MTAAAEVLEDDEGAAEVVTWAPQAGPQTTFAECDADIAIYGGAAGGGKSFALLYEAAKWSHVRGYRAVLFRRTVPDLLGGGGLWDESQSFYPVLGGRPRAGGHLDWVFPSGARVEFRHMLREKDRFGHQGRSYAFVGFDELTHFTASQFWYLFGRLRSKCGVRPYLRATTNPDPSSFVRKLIAWWIGPDGYPIQSRSGVVRYFVRVEDEVLQYDTREEALAAHPGRVPNTLTFIASRLEDNPALERVDPTYRDRLGALGRVDRLRLLGDPGRGGNWRVKEAAGLVFRREDFVVADAPPSRIIRSVRAWDIASLPPSAERPDPDWTRGARVHLCEGGQLWIDDLVGWRERSAVTLRRMREVAAGTRAAGELVRATRPTAHELGDGPSVVICLWQDPGGAGVIAIDTIRDALFGFPTETQYTSADKLAFAKVWAPLVERHAVHLKRASWNETLLAEADSFPSGDSHDDAIDAVNLAALKLLGTGGGLWSTISEAARRLEG